MLRFIILPCMLWTLSLHAQILPADRLLEWSPGIPDGFPEKSTILDVRDFGATGDGITDDTHAFEAALLALPDDGLLFIPEGSYLLQETLDIDQPILLCGAGADRTQLFFDLGGRSNHCINIHGGNRGDWIDVVGDVDRGATNLVLSDADGFNGYEFAEIQMENDPALMYTRPKWDQPWAENAVGQILRLSRIEGNTLILEKPLNLAYPADRNPVIRTVEMLMYPGIEDLTIERLDAGEGRTIVMRYSAHGRLFRIESANTFLVHVYLSQSYGCEIRQCYFHHAFDYGSGGHGYGVDVIHHATDNLVIDNVFEHLRHSMLTHLGTSGNVFAYNYSTERSPERVADISLHGHYAAANLFESNVIEEIDVPDHWGPTGPNNTFLRNRITAESIEIRDASHDQNLVGNVLDSRYIYQTDDVTGTLKHGNVENGVVQWDASISQHDLPASYFLDEKPDFLDGFPWPLIGPDVVGDHKLPAQLRCELETPVPDPDEAAVIPRTLSLTVHPNPFNAAAVIRFTLAESAHAHIGLYDLHGREIAVLGEGRFDRGEHTVLLNSDAGLPSGIYLIRIRTQRQAGSKKTTHIK